MLNELVEFGRRIRQPGASDALKREFVSADIMIDAQGNYHGMVPVDKHPTLAEAIQAKKGKARLLLDKAEEVLGLDAKKHRLFLQKLEQYRQVPSLKPVLLFYEGNKANGLDKATEAFAQLPEKEKPTGNFAFCLLGEHQRIHEKADVRAAVIASFDTWQKKNINSGGPLCSLCGRADHPILDIPHGMIKNVPSGQTSGCALVSYNEDAFESYGLKGNENASICTACARNYVEGLNYLLNNGTRCTSEKGKAYTQYSNRKNLSADTAMVFWTRSLAPVPELDFVDGGQDSAPAIAALIMGSSAFATSPRDDALLLLLNSPFSAKRESLQSVDVDRFYSCMLSGSAARISVRNWIEATTPTVRANVAKWFHDIAVIEWDYNSKQAEARFFPLAGLAGACAVHRKKEIKGQTQFVLDREDPFLGRASTVLWNCALLGVAPPYALLDRVLRRIRLEEGRVTALRASVLKLILNRNFASNHAGGQSMQPQLDKENTGLAYSAGRIFAMLESIQTAALGKDLNAPLRDRFFSFASTSPASAFGRLMKLAQTHLAKLRREKRGLAVTLDRELGELFARVERFPVTFSLEEQGQFAIGYYHQRQDFLGRGEPAINDLRNDATTETSSTRG